MALGSDFRFVNSHSHPFSCSVKDRIHLPQFTVPLLSAGIACQLHSRMQKKSPTARNEAVTLKNASLLLDKIPEKRVSFTKDSRDSRFAENIEFPEQGKRDAGDLTLIDPPGNVLLLPDRQRVIGALLFCGGIESLELGRIWHALIIKTGLAGDQFVVATLISMYAKCEKMDDALMVLDKMSCVNVVSCNSLISGYSRKGLLDQALRFLVRMESMLIEPNQYTYSILLSLCEKCSAIKEGHQLHAWILKRGYLPRIAVGNALLTMYCKCGMMKKAKVLFETLPQRNLITWTAFINGSYRNGDFEEALRQFHLMRESGIEPNEYTFTVALASCASMQHFEGGRMIHAQVIKKRVDLDVHVGTAILDMYSALGEMDDAQKQFRGMGRTASIVTWNALLAGFVHNELIDEAIKAFHKMVEDDIARDEFTYSVMLKASSSLLSLSSCEQIHSRVIKANLDVNAHVGSSLVEAYAQCGNLEDADRIFRQISEPDVVLWNSIIKAYSKTGYPAKTMELFDAMIKAGNKPTSSTFLAILSACSHSGLVQEGQELFKSMVKEYGIPPEDTHYSSMVDLLGRNGKLEDALDFINRLPIKPTAPIWRPLLAACRCNNNIPMAEFVAQKIFELDPQDPTVDVTLSNMYAENGRLADAYNQRRLMELKSISKEPGCSWIEVENKIHKFFSRDKRHPQMPKVYEKLRQLKGIDFHSTTLYHSEKLALCFGLLNLPATKPIRVFKNLRVCKDCHSTMKHVSRITEREVILRDNYRFHHFKEGFCSCGDYW